MFMKLCFKSLTDKIDKYHYKWPQCIMVDLLQILDGMLQNSPIAEIGYKRYLSYIIFLSVMVCGVQRYHKT